MKTMKTMPVYHFTKIVFQLLPYLLLNYLHLYTCDRLLGGGTPYPTSTTSFFRILDYFRATYQAGF